jgi:hypothetical protein
MQHRATGDLVENLGRIALHPGTKASGHDEDEGALTTHVWHETYTIRHNEGVTGRVALLGIFATLGCDASLGAGNDSQVDAAVSDAPRADVSIRGDASPDARTCTGGNAAALAPDGSCLVHFTTAVTYANAKASCAGMGWHLAYIKDAALDTFAQNFVGAVDTWIGGTDSVTEGTHRWDDGTAFIFTNWAALEPNNGNGTYQEDCVVIAGARAGKLWDDRPCNASENVNSGLFAYLCQH